MPSSRADRRPSAIHTLLLASTALWLGTLAPRAVAQAIERISVASGGAVGDGISDDASISDDGNRVAFASAAANLVASDTNGVTDIFLRDRAAGTTIRSIKGRNQALESEH